MLTPPHIHLVWRADLLLTMVKETYTAEYNFVNNRQI